MVAGYLMTGGKNRRMEGQKKIFLSFQGKTFGEHILDVLSKLHKVYLSVEKEEPYTALSLPKIVDEIQGIGPMGGIYSGLKNVEEEAILVVACDMPFITEAAVDRLLDAYRADKKITIAWSEGRLQPLFGIYPKTALPYFQEQIEEGSYRLLEVLYKAGYVSVELPVEDPSVKNINTPAEYKDLCGSINKDLSESVSKDLCGSK